MFYKSSLSKGSHLCGLLQFCSVGYMGAFVPVAFASPARVSTVGKLCLVVVTVQGAPVGRVLLKQRLVALGRVERRGVRARGVRDCRRVPGVDFLQIDLWAWTN